MALLIRILRAIPLLAISPLLILAAAAGLLATDFAWLLFGRRKLPVNRPARMDRASVVIPNWNGRDLLEKYLPSVVAAMSGHPGNEVIVVDNGSEDGSAEYLRQHFPSVRVLALPRNLGFGGGSNAGFRAANNDIVVLLNSDMRVDPDFLAPLLAGFADPSVFAVSCQIFFSDPAKKREETGLTQAQWSEGMLRVRHRLDDKVTDLYPCFYGGGGSCAFDRAKFLELGGFDELLKPFYLEDTDLGYLAWKRGWRVLYQPRSIVFHEHRGTIGKKFSPEFIQGVLKKNFLLFVWKNVFDWRMLLSHFGYAWAGSAFSLFFGDSMERASVPGLARACWQLPGAMGARWRARTLGTITDRDAFRRPLGGYFEDMRQTRVPGKLRILFVSPYAVLPPVHGGAVFMSQTIRALAPLVELHLIILVDSPQETAAHAPLEEICASVEFMVRLEGRPKQIGSIDPYAVREFSNPDLDWLIHRQLHLKRIDVLQLEYTQLGQYAHAYRRIARALFEHDVYFQTLGRLLRQPAGLLNKIPVSLEYLRTLRYELRLLSQLDHVQMCSSVNRDYVLQLAPQLAPKLEAGLRAGITLSEYEYSEMDRVPDTILFLGSFRHGPNQEAVFWFVRDILRHIVQARPSVRFIIVGSDPPDRHALPYPAEPNDPIQIIGFVDDIRGPLRTNAVFVCPILTGSGIRVKLLEAFASGIPVVSTRLGAEGLAEADGETCRLADDAEEFARKTVELLAEQPIDMTRRARREVETNWDLPVLTEKLVQRYQDLVQERS